MEIGVKVTLSQGIKKGKINTTSNTFMRQCFL